MIFLCSFVINIMTWYYKKISCMYPCIFSILSFFSPSNIQETAKKNCGLIKLSFLFSFSNFQVHILLLLISLIFVTIYSHQVVLFVLLRLNCSQWCTCSLLLFFFLITDDVAMEVRLPFLFSSLWMLFFCQIQYQNIYAFNSLFPICF